MLQYFDMPGIVALFELWSYVHLHTHSDYQTHSSPSQMWNLCRKIDAICITSSIKEITIRENGEVLYPTHKDRPLHVSFNRWIQQ
jgi:hypothetical protein